MSPVAGSLPLYVQLGIGAYLAGAIARDSAGGGVSTAGELGVEVAIAGGADGASGAAPAGPDGLLQHTQTRSPEPA